MNSEKIVDEIAALVSDVEAGNKYALQAFVEMKKLSKVLEDSLEQIKESAIKEAKQEGQKTFDKFGATVQVKEGSARYSYKHINVWNELELRKKQIETAAKNRALNPSLAIADQESGEEIPPALVTYDKESIAVTIKNY